MFSLLLLGALVFGWQPLHLLLAFPEVQTPPQPAQNLQRPMRSVCNNSFQIPGLGQVSEPHEEGGGVGAGVEGGGENN